MGRVLDSHDNTRVINGSYEGGWMAILSIPSTIKKLVSLMDIVKIMVRYMRSIEHEKRGRISVKEWHMLVFDTSGEAISEGPISRMHGIENDQVCSQRINIIRDIDSTIPMK